jgi:hypothetical protein
MVNGGVHNVDTAATQLWLKKKKERKPMGNKKQLPINGAPKPHARENTEGFHLGSLPKAMDRNLCSVLKLILYSEEMVLLARDISLHGLHLKAMCNLKALQTMAVILEQQVLTGSSIPTPK